MENNCWSIEQHALLRELIQGMETTKQLRLLLNSASSMETRDCLIQRILSSYEKSLSILNSGQQQNAAAVVPVAAAVGNVPESPISPNGSQGSDDFDGGQVNASKKRKTMPKWIDHVRVGPENGLEGPHDDGYSWRKYGQKDILGTKYPRSYYRCTYRNTQDCCATKQVQRSDNDPTVFEITYRGVHTCSLGQQQSTSPEKHHNTSSNSYQEQQLSQATLFNFQNTLRVNTNTLDNTEAVFPFSFPQTSGYSQSHISPTTPEPRYCQVSPFQTSNFAGAGNFLYYDSVSTNTSATNSPLVEPDFSLQALQMDPNFPFDTPDFFLNPVRFLVFNIWFTLSESLS